MNEVLKSMVGKASPEQIRKIRQAVQECDRYIAIEGPRAADLRPAKIAVQLAFYIQHRADLMEVLASQVGA